MGKIFFPYLLFLAFSLASKVIHTSEKCVEGASEGNKVCRESVNSNRVHCGAPDEKETHGVKDIWGLGTDHIIGGDKDSNSLLFCPSSPKGEMTFFISKQDNSTAISVPSFPKEEVGIIKIKNISPDSEFIKLSQIDLNEVDVHVYNTHDYGYTFEFYDQLRPFNETRKFRTELGHTLYLLVSQKNSSDGTFYAKAKSIPYNLGSDTKIIVGVFLIILVLLFIAIWIVVYFWIKHKRRGQVTLGEALTPEERMIIQAQQNEAEEWRNRVSSGSSTSKESFDSDLNLEDIEIKTENLVFENNDQELLDEEKNDMEQPKWECENEKEKSLNEPLVPSIN